jgi:hypothetical protein
MDGLDVILAPPTGKYEAAVAATRTGDPGGRYKGQLVLP